MLQWPPLTGTQLSTVAPGSSTLPSGHTPSNLHDQRAKPGESAHTSSLECSFFFDNPSSNRPERMTALVARELARYKVDIAALTELRFSKQSQLVPATPSSGATGQRQSEVKLIHLRIHRTEIGELVPGAPTHSSDHYLQCPHCRRAFTHRMGLLGHLTIHESGIHRDASAPNTTRTPINTLHSPMKATNSTSNTTSADSAPPDRFCPHCHRT
ncbi:unnamed protein product [Schistocephalus solidus]|uniref:C2H2-type domain-containing protein n=1 Tax=Schistocephalus solidus TaxID=70667 RepID=A0A183SQ09_SCHSO|nr:unnamed protein product [Schistocephalus solidus]